MQWAEQEGRAGLRVRCMDTCAAPYLLCIGSRENDDNACGDAAPIGWEAVRVCLSVREARRHVAGERLS